MYAAGESARNKKNKECPYKRSVCSLGCRDLTRLTNLLGVYYQIRDDYVSLKGFEVGRYRLHFALFCGSNSNSCVSRLFESYFVDTYKVPFSSYWYVCGSNEISKWARMCCESKLRCLPRAALSRLMPIAWRQELRCKLPSLACVKAFFTDVRWRLWYFVMSMWTFAVSSSVVEWGCFFCSFSICECWDS